MASWSDWELAWDGKEDFRDKLTINSPLPAKWFQWRYRFQIESGFAANEAMMDTQMLLGLMGGGVASMAVGSINGKEFQHRVIFDIVGSDDSPVVKWEMVTKFTVVSLSYQFGGFAFYTWYSARQELTTYLPGVGNTLGLENANATILKARELDKYHPVSKIITSTSGETNAFEGKDITGEPLNTLGTQGITVIQDTTYGTGFPQSVQFFGWFLGPLYNLSVPAGAVIDIKFHNIGVPVGDRWAFIETRSSSSPISPEITKITSFQGDNPGAPADSAPNGIPKPKDGKNYDLKNAFFAAGATDNVGRSEIYYPETTNKVIKQFLGVTDFEETRDKYDKSIIMGGGSGKKIQFPDTDMPIDTETVQGSAPEFVKNEQGVSNLFYHIEVTGKLLKTSALYRSLINGAAIKTTNDFSNLQEGKLKIVFSSDGTSTTIEEIDVGTSVFIEKIVIENSRLIKGNTYEFSIAIQEEDDGDKYYFISDTDQKKGIYCVQSSDQGESWERNLANIENPDNFNGGRLTIGGEIVSGIQENPNNDPLFIAENESFPISVKEDDLGRTKLFSIQNNSGNYNLILRNFEDIDLYSQRLEESQTRDKNIQDTHALMIGGNLTPQIHENMRNNFPYFSMGAFKLKEVIYGENAKYIYHCLKCNGNMVFQEYRNSGNANDDVEELNKKYDQIIYKCDTCLTEYDIVELFKRELIIEQPISLLKMPSGAQRFFYTVSSQDWTLETNVINDTSAENYDYISLLEGFKIYLNDNIENSEWTVYVDEKGDITHEVSPTSASDSILNMDASDNYMLRQNSFSFQLKNSGDAKIFSIPKNIIMSRYSFDGENFIYDSQFNRSMVNMGHSAVLAKYDYEVNQVKLFSYKSGNIYLNEYPLTVLEQFQLERRDRGLLPLKEEELKEDTSISENSQVFLVWGKITKEYQEKINKLPNRYFLGNFVYYKNTYVDGEIMQQYLYNPSNKADIMRFDRYDEDDNVIYIRLNTGEDINITEMTQDYQIDEQVVSYNKTEQGKERLYYQKPTREIDITNNSTSEDIYNGFTIVFGELQEGWVSAVFEGTVQQDDLRIEGTAQDSIVSISIKDNYLVDREIRFTIKSTDDNGFVIETEAVPAVLIYEDGRWHEDNKNI